jgi:predicted nucleotidyltransferase
MFGRFGGLEDGMRRANTGTVILSARPFSRSLALVLLSLTVLCPAGARGEKDQLARVQKLMARESRQSVAQAFLAKRVQVMGIRSFCRGAEDHSGKVPVHPGTFKAVLNALRTVYGSKIVAQALAEDARNGYGLSHPQYRAPGSGGKAKARDLPPGRAIYVDLGELPLHVLKGVVALDEKHRPSTPMPPIDSVSPLYSALKEINIDGRDLSKLRRGGLVALPKSAKDTLLTRRLQAVGSVGAKLKVRSLSLFGSSSRGEEKPDSDYDFLVKLSPGQSYGVLDDLRHGLTRATGRKVDVVPIEYFPSASMQQGVLADAIPIWKK